MTTLLSLESALRHDPLRKAIAKERPYKLPKSYPSWDLLSAIAAMSIHQSRLLPSKPDDATSMHNALWYKWADELAPLYCISPDLLEQFQLTDADNLSSLVPAEWVPSVPMFLLCLPSGALVTPAGNSLLYFLLLLSHPEVPSSICADHPRQISFAAIDDIGTVWVSGVGLEDGKLLQPNNLIGQDPESIAEYDWLKFLIAIALQSALTLEYLPDLIDDGQPPMKNRKPARAQDNSTLYPRWIGRNFKKARPAGQIVGTHSSPVAHWRRGHWRSQPIGEGRKARRLVWLQPTMINTSK